MKPFRFRILAFFSFSLLGLAAIAQQPAAPTTAEQAKQKLDEAHAKAAEAGKPAGADAAKPGAPLNFNNVPVPPPKVIAPKNQVKAKTGTNIPTTIDALHLVYSQDQSVATFTGNVKLRSLNMDIDCEELVLYFKKGALQGTDTPPPTKPDPKKPTTPTPPPAFDPNKPSKPDPLEAAPADPKADPAEGGGQQIEKALAKGMGSIVTIVKRAPTDTSVCKCGDATYTDKTGMMVMKIWPEVFKGGKGLRANDRDTIIMLDRNNNLTSNGNLKTVLPNDDNDKKAGKTDADKTDAAATPAAPGTTPKPAKPAKPATPPATAAPKSTR